VRSASRAHACGRGACADYPSGAFRDGVIGNTRHSGCRIWGSSPCPGAGFRGAFTGRLAFKRAAGHGGHGIREPPRESARRREKRARTRRRRARALGERLLMLREQPNAVAGRRADRSRNLGASEHADEAANCAQFSPEGAIDRLPGPPLGVRACAGKRPTRFSASQPKRSATYGLAVVLPSSQACQTGTPRIVRDFSCRWLSYGVIRTRYASRHPIGAPGRPSSPPPKPASGASWRAG
jgi:hypothetical protein